MHSWKFFRLGGFDHVSLAGADDLDHLPELDPKLWAVLSSPSKGMEFDAATLAFLDADGDGRVRLAEVQNALRWLSRVLRDRSLVLTRATSLPLQALNDDDSQGRLLLETARHVLGVLGKTGAANIELADAVQAAEALRKAPLNGDAIVTPLSTPDGVLAAAIADVLACTGGVADASGAEGIGAEQVQAFFGGLRDYAAWQSAPAGVATGVDPDAHAAYQAVQAKIEDFFTRCGIAAFDPAAEARLNDFDTRYTALAGEAIQRASAGLVQLPLARIAPGAALPLTRGVNPAWADAVQLFQTKVVAPAFGPRETLSPDDWAALCKRYEEVSAWLKSKPGLAFDKLGPARVAELLAGDFEGRLQELITQDEAMRAHVDNLAALEKLLRYVRYLDVFLRNYVSLEAFYSRGEPAIFQAGTLYIDGRSCNLCLKVDSPAKHASLAALSRTYLLYCDCVRRGGAERMTILAAVTAGDSDNLMVGRNGMFVDRAGEEWDATVVHIVDNPISVRQAIWSPYQRAGRLINEQIQKFAGDRQKKASDATAAAVDAAGTGKAPEQPFDVAKFAGIFAAVGLAVGALGTAVAALLTGLLSLEWWQMPLALAGFFAVVSGPSAVLAWFKLRERNLAPILDASGWAINTKAKINLLFGATLTATAKLPPGSTVRLTDPYVDEASAKRRKRIMWFMFVTALTLVGLYVYHGFTATAPTTPPAGAEAPALPK